jgi:hypothetical protein
MEKIKRAKISNDKFQVTGLNLKFTGITETTEGD